MNTDQLIAESLRILKLANDRTRTVGAQQYAGEEDHHRFIDMSPLELLDYSKEETLDFINYGVMLTILLERTEGRIQALEAQVRQETGRVTEELRVLELKRSNASGHVTKLEQRQAALQEQNERVQRAIEQGEHDLRVMELRRGDAAADVDTLQQTRNRISKEIENLRQFAGKAGAEREERLKAREELEAEILKLQVEIERLKSFKNGYEMEDRDLRMALGDLDQERRSVIAQLQSLREDVKSLKQTYEELQQGIQEQEGRQGDLLSNIRELEEGDKEQDRKAPGLACASCYGPIHGNALEIEGFYYHPSCFQQRVNKELTPLPVPITRPAQERMAHYETVKKAAPSMPVMEALERAEVAAADFMQAMGDARRASGGS